jgi:hypothetical protein
VEITVHSETITYLDYDGVEHTDKFWFHLTPAEILRFEMDSASGCGLEKLIQRLITETDSGKIYSLFETLILTAYGRKSLDARRFEKSPELSAAFKQSEAYSELIMKFFQDGEFAATFMEKLASKPKAPQDHKPPEGSSPTPLE